MPITDPRIDAYIARQADFARPILEHLRARFRAICPDATEAIKWGMPFFVYKKQILGNMAAFKAHAAFGFWDRQALATGQEGHAMGQYGRLDSLSKLPPDAEIDANIRAAMALIDAGEKPKRLTRGAKPEAEIPAELAKALAGDAVAHAAFTGFPPGCRREYCAWIGQAKRPETRARRVAEAIAWLREGKRRNWKHENR